MLECKRNEEARKVGAIFEGPSKVVMSLNFILKTARNRSEVLSIRVTRFFFLSLF